MSSLSDEWVQHRAAVHIDAAEPGVEPWDLAVEVIWPWIAKPEDPRLNPVLGGGTIPE